MMKKQQNQILITLLGVIILLLIVVIIIFATQKAKQDGPQVATTDTTAVNQGTGETSREPVYREPDSVRVTDQIKLSAIQSFFEKYSYANKAENTEELVDSYVYPAVYQSKIYDRDKMRRTVSGFFDNTEAVEHYFTDIIAYEFRNGEVSAFANEYHTTYDLKYGKETKYKVYKSFHLVQTGSGYKCSEQHSINRAKVY